MKTILPVLLLLICASVLQAQITTPVIKAGFGVDGELRANFFQGINQSGNDDWFSNSFGTGKFVIDTTGAAAIVAGYNADVNSRKIPFYRTMRVAPYSLMNNFMVIDAVFIRDYHGTDSTIFAAGSNKNGMSPANWTTPVAQSIPDKNEILDMMVHVRRAGPNPTDSLWMFGGLSIENTVGNRYFDFEMYQTDIYYDRASLKFYGYGPDAGHTSWQFDAAGEITRPGDIVFAAEYSSNMLTKLEARIWIDRASLSITPTGFSWTGSFDGASSGSQYGYAGITPKTAGAFYTGLSSPSNTWAGPFSLVKGDNTLSTTYVAAQFMEFSVNLSKLGLDPVTLLGGNQCGMPFRRVLVKSRSSTSFTSELKDFVGPYDFFLAPRANAEADIPYYCGTMGVSEIQVTNPVETSVYTWSTPDGNIVGSTSGPSTTVNSPGTYIVRQQLQSGCSTYATDTVMITYDASCSVLESDLLDFHGSIKNTVAKLDWTISSQQQVKNFVLERSLDGLSFNSVQSVPADASGSSRNMYNVTDDLGKIGNQTIYYRLKIVMPDGQYRYSRIIAMRKIESSTAIASISPNPGRNAVQVNIFAPADATAQISIYNLDGKLLRSKSLQVQRGNSFIAITDVEEWPVGIYPVKIVVGNETFTERLVLTR